MLDDNYSGAEPKLDAHQISELKAYFEEHILPDAKSVIAHIDKQYGGKIRGRLPYFCLSYHA